MFEKTMMVEAQNGTYWLLACIGLINRDGRCVAGRSVVVHWNHSSLLGHLEHSYDIAFMCTNAKERHVHRNRLRVVVALKPGDRIEVRAHHIPAHPLTCSLARTHSPTHLPTYLPTYLHPTVHPRTHPLTQPRTHPLPTHLALRHGTED